MDRVQHCNSDSNVWVSLLLLNCHTQKIEVLCQLVNYQDAEIESLFFQQGWFLSTNQNGQFWFELTIVSLQILLGI